jgi:hypothetical protein
LTKAKLLGKAIQEDQENLWLPPSLYLSIFIWEIEVSHLLKMGRANSPFGKKSAKAVHIK